jgi:hypothetical protein
MAKGKKTGGRRPGSCNVDNRDAKEAFRLIYERQLEHLQTWIERTGEESPGRAAELVLRLAEHFVPKLSAVQHSGDINIQTSGLTDAQLLAKAKALTEEASGADSSGIGAGAPEASKV